jgi:ATP-binding cassette, subfamily C (CFTR/MRP), member 1
MTGWYSHMTFRLMSMMRGQLVALIYDKLLTLEYTNTENSSAMTLMGTDVPKIAETFHMLLLDIVPDTVQLAVAIYLLYAQIGAVCIAPIIITISEFLI